MAGAGVEGPASAERSEVRCPEPSDQARPKDHEASLRAEGPATARPAACKQCLLLLLE